MQSAEKKNKTKGSLKLYGASIKVGKKNDGGKEEKPATFVEDN